MEAAIVLGTFGFVKAINYCQTPDLDQDLSLGVDFVFPLEQEPSPKSTGRMLSTGLKFGT